MGYEFGGCGADDVADRSEITVSLLSAVFPQWRIVQRKRTLWALRGGEQHLDGPQSLLKIFVKAHSPWDLAELLCMQEYLRRLDPGELAAAWRNAALPTPRPLQ
jgi:hypothetical protein